MLRKNVCNPDDLISALEIERDQILTQYGPSVANACTSNFPKMIHHEIFAAGRLDGIKTAMDMITGADVWDSKKEIRRLEKTIEDLENQIEDLEREGRN